MSTRMSEISVRQCQQGMRIHVPPHSEAITGSRREHDNGHPYKYERSQYHPHSIPEHNFKLQVIQVLQLVLCHDHQCQVNTKHDTRQNGSDDGENKVEYRKPMGISEEGEDESEEGQGCRNRVQDENDEKGFFYGLDGLLRDANEGGYGGWHVIAQRWAETETWVGYQCWLVQCTASKT